MAKISKHTRKSGATTVKSEGKIVGNIGRGKAGVPHGAKKYISTENSTSDATTITQITDIRKAQVQYSLLENDDLTNVSYDNAIVMWNLTEGQPLHLRLNVTVNFFNKIDSTNGDREKFLSYIIPRHENCDNFMGVQKIRNGIEHKDADPRIFSMIVEHPDDVLQKLVANNEKAPIELLDFLSNSTNNIVRTHVARNTITSPATLIKLAKDKETTIKALVLYHPHVPIEALKILAQDANSAMAREALFYLNRKK